MKKILLAIYIFSLLFTQEAYAEQLFRLIQFDHNNLQELGLSRKLHTSPKSAGQSTFAMTIDEKNEFEKRLEQLKPRWDLTTIAGYKVTVKLSNNKKKLLQFEVKF